MSRCWFLSRYRRPPLTFDTTCSQEMAPKHSYRRTHRLPYTRNESGKLSSLTPSPVRGALTCGIHNASVRKALEAKRGASMFFLAPAGRDFEKTQHAYSGIVSPPKKKREAVSDLRPCGVEAMDREVTPRIRPAKTRKVFR